jgi:hypothetical protein
MPLPAVYKDDTVEPSLRRSSITGITQIPFKMAILETESHGLATQEERRKQNGITPRNRMASERRSVSMPDSRLVGESRPLNASPNAFPRPTARKNWHALLDGFGLHVSPADFLSYVASSIFSVS